MEYFNCFRYLFPANNVTTLQICSNIMVFFVHKYNCFLLFSKQYLKVEIAYTDFRKLLQTCQLLSRWCCHLQLNHCLLFKQQCH